MPLLLCSYLLHNIIMSITDSPTLESRFANSLHAPWAYGEKNISMFHSSGSMTRELFDPGQLLHLIDTQFPELNEL